MHMKSIRLNEWAITMLNQAIRADAEFQINQRNAWLEFARDMPVFDGIDIAAGFQHQRSLFLDEVTFEMDLVPDIPTFRDRLVSALSFRKAEKGLFYRLRKENGQNPEGMHVRLVIKRNIDNRYKGEVVIEPKGLKKPEDIHLVGVSR
jgi:hypothetical protein